MEASCSKWIRQALRVARELTILADEGESQSRDDGCVVLYGVVRDCAYKIRQEAERERNVHRRMGFWDTPADASSEVDLSRERGEG